MLEEGSKVFLMPIPTFFNITGSQLEHRFREGIGVGNGQHVAIPLLLKELKPVQSKCLQGHSHIVV